MHTVASQSKGIESAAHGLEILSSCITNPG